MLVDTQPELTVDPSSTKSPETIEVTTNTVPTPIKKKGFNAPVVVNSTATATTATSTDKSGAASRSTGYVKQMSKKATLSNDKDKKSSTKDPHSTSKSKHKSSSSSSSAHDNKHSKDKDRHNKDKEKHTKKKKDKNAPKGASSAYIFFAAKLRSGSYSYIYIIYILYNY